MNCLLRNFFLQLHRKPLAAVSHEISNRRLNVVVFWERSGEIALVTFAIGYQT